MRVRDRVGPLAAGLLGPFLLRGMYSSLKFDMIGGEHLNSWRAGEPTVFVVWHGRLLPLLYRYRGERIVLLVSQHRDGEYLARVGHGLGYDSVRGSSSHGGASAVRQLVRRVQAGDSLAITPDGPRGPKERFKPGVLQVARITEAPVIPILAGSQHGWWIEGWDSFLVPKPFARIRIAVGPPRIVPGDTPTKELVEHARELETELETLKSQVDGQGTNPSGEDA